MSRFTRSNPSPNPTPHPRRPRGELPIPGRKAPRSSNNENFSSVGVERCEEIVPRLAFLPGQEPDPPGDRHGRTPAVRNSPRATGRAAEALVFREQGGTGPGHRPEGSGWGGAERPGAGPRASALPSTRACPRLGRGAGVRDSSGGGSPPTRTTSNRVPPAPLFADAGVGTPD